MKKHINEQYCLSVCDSNQYVVQYEKNIQKTKLGELFDKKASEFLNCDVVISRFFVNKNNISLTLKVRGIQGGHFGIISIFNEDDIKMIKSETCRNIWNAFLESAEELDISIRCFSKRKDTYKLSIDLYDFDKCARIGYFENNVDRLQSLTQLNFPNVDFYLRWNDSETNIYYLIFKNEQQKETAENIYGIKSMTDYVYNICLSEDKYGVFKNYYPQPIITDLATLKQSGEIMGIIRNNPQFTSWS